MKIPSNTAKWLLRPSDSLPPIAFAMPLDETDKKFLALISTREDAEKFANDYARHAFCARYEKLKDRFEQKLLYWQHLLTKLLDREAALTEQHHRLGQTITIERRHLELPKGPLKVWLAFLTFLLVACGVVEWINIAGFAGRGEFQSMAMALGFTMSFVIAPLALKMASNRFVIALLLLTGLGFAISYTDAYVVNQHLTIDELLNGGLNESGTVTWLFQPLSKEWRLIMQILLFGIISYATSSYIARHITIRIEIEHRPSRTYCRIEKELEELGVKIRDCRKKIGTAQGNIHEWNASLQLHTDWCICIIRGARELRQKRKFAQDAAAREADIFNQDFQGLLTRNEDL